MDGHEGKVRFGWQSQDNSGELLTALLEDEGFADAVQRIISTETAWKAARREPAEAAA